MKGLHSTHLLHLKAEEGLCVGNSILLTKTENRMATSPFFCFFQVLAYYVLRIYVGKLATVSIDLFYLIRAVMSILNLRIDADVSVVLDFLSDVVLKSASKFLQKSFVSNHSSWIFSRQNGKIYPELSPPDFC